MRKFKALPIKSIVIAALAVIVCLCAASCAAGDPDLPEGMQLVPGEDLNFKLYVPRTWTVDSSGGYTSAYFSVDDPSNVSVMGYASGGEQETPGIGAYIDGFLEQYTAQFPGTELLERTETELDKYPAERIIFTSTVSGVEYKFMQIVTLLGDFYYILTYTSSAELYQSHMTEVDLIVENFKFK